MRRKVNSWEDSLIHGRTKDALDLSGKLNEDGTSLVWYCALCSCFYEAVERTRMWLAKILVGLGPVIYLRPFPVGILGHSDVGT